MSRVRSRPYNHPESIRTAIPIILYMKLTSPSDDRYISSCHIAYNTLNDRHKKLFKYCIRDVAEFRALIDEWQRQHESRIPGPEHEALESRRLQAALRRIIEDGRLPPFGPPLIEEDASVGSAFGTAANQTGPSQDRAVASSHSLSGSSAVRARATDVAPTAQAQAQAPPPDRGTGTQRRRFQAIMAQDRVLGAQARDPPSALPTRVSRAATSNRGGSSGGESSRRGASRGTACCRIS